MLKPAFALLAAMIATSSPAATPASIDALVRREMASARANGLALAVIDEFDPEVVLLDIGMPFMDGYEVARRIRARRGNSVRLIALTGWGQDEDVRRAERAGFDHHLVKPPNIEKLGKLLAEVHVAGRA